MGEASYAVAHFLSGEWSQFAQGRFDRPDYRYALNVCFNMFPEEVGALVRRPGTIFGGHTRGGLPGRVIKFDFDQAVPVTLEFTDGFLRFRNGAVLITTNDAQTVSAISTANPAVVQTAAAHGCTTGNTVVLQNGIAPLLENRQFVVTVIDTTHFSLTDALTTATIDGSTLGAIAASKTVSRVHELATSYVGGAWSGIRAVQAETTDILLSGTVPPQVITVTTPPSANANAQFALNPATFNDGPYLDPFTNGVQVTPSALSGIITLTLAFPAYSATTAYAKGAFVTSSGTNYKSLQDQNEGNTPASSPTFWATTSAGAAIGPSGFQGTDVGRLVRMFSEPPLWNITTDYAAGKEVVSYNPSGVPGASTYWQNQTPGNTGAAPGSDLINWKLIPQGAAIWTWGKITSLSNVIDRALSGSNQIGTLTNGGGINAPFNGNFAQPATASAQLSVNVVVLAFSVTPTQQVATISGYVGKNYSGASAQKIQQAIVFPSTSGLAFGSWTDFTGAVAGQLQCSVLLNLRGKTTAPANEADGVLLASNGPSGNVSNAVILTSSDQVTAYNYVWIEILVTASTGIVTPVNTAGITINIGQISFFNPTGTGTSSGINVEILGPPLIYTNPIVTWRLGVYSNTTGWPTCGCYDDGRLWLGGAVGNRFDASVSNGIVGGTINFAPTDQYGVVAASNAISETINSDSVNPIFWMEPDLQGILMGTQAAEFLVLAPTSGSISPLNITSRRVTKIGCGNVEPKRTDHTIVFVQRFAVKLMEMFPDVYSGKFSAPNLSERAQHITRVGIAEIAYQSATTPIIWGRDTAGALFGATYKRDTLTTAQGPTINAWHRHGLGSGRVVESLTVGPSTDGDLDTLTMVTNDPLTNIRHVELLTDTMDELSPLTSAWFLDDAVTPTSTVSTTVSQGPSAPYGGLTINGLWHLNGKTIQIFAGGLDCGNRGTGSFGFTDFVVTNGSVFVPYGDDSIAGSGGGLFTAAYVASITPFPIVVGFTFTSMGQLVRPLTQADTGARNGPAFAKLSREHRFGMKLVNTLGLYVGANLAKKLFPALFKQADRTTAIPPLTTFSGIHQDTLNDDYTYDAALCWRIERPYPANIVMVGTNLATMDQ